MVLTEDTMTWSGQIELHFVNRKHCVVFRKDNEIDDGLLDRITEPLNELCAELDAGEERTEEDDTEEEWTEDDEEEVQTARLKKMILEGDLAVHMLNEDGSEVRLTPRRHDGEPVELSAKTPCVKIPEKFFEEVEQE